MRAITEPMYVFEQILGMLSYTYTMLFSSFELGIGVIKGSEEACMAPRGYLDEQDYDRVKMRRSQNALSDQNDAVYQLFQNYSKIKRARGEYDHADRYLCLYSSISAALIPATTNAILTELRKVERGGVPRRARGKLPVGYSHFILFEIYSFFIG